MKIYSILNRPNYQGKKISSVSETLPDQTMSIREILERHAKGLPIADSKTPIYDEDETSRGINPKTLDLVDLQELAMRTNDDVSRLQNEIKEAKTRKVKTEHVQDIKTDPL